MTIHGEFSYGQRLSKMPNRWPRQILRERIATQAAFLVCLTLCFVLFARSASPDQLSVDQILKKVSETYQQLQSYQMTAEKTDQVLLGDIRFNDWAVDNSVAIGGLKLPPGTAMLSPVKWVIELAKASPGKVRLDYKVANSEVLLVSDGLTTWAYSSKKNQYTEKLKSTPAVADQSGTQDKGESVLVNQFEDLLVNRFRNVPKYSSNYVLEKDSQIKVGGDKIDCYVLKMVTQHEQHAIWVDKVRFIVWRSVDSNPLDNPYNPTTPSYKTSTVDVKMANLDANLQDDLFKFAPPDKAKKVDTLNPPAK